MLKTDSTLSLPSLVMKIVCCVNKHSQESIDISLHTITNHFALYCYLFLWIWMKLSVSQTVELRASQFVKCTSHVKYIFSETLTCKWSRSEICCLLCIYTMTCQCIAKQRLNKHPAICARNNRTNVYSKSARQWTSEIAITRLLFSVWSALRNSRTVFSALSVPRLYNTSPHADKKSPEEF
jgi:hypothetical protein